MLGIVSGKEIMLLSKETDKIRANKYLHKSIINLLNKNALHQKKENRETNFIIEWGEQSHQLKYVTQLKIFQYIKKNIRWWGQSKS